MRINFQEEHKFLHLSYPPTPYPMIPIRLIGKRGQTADTYALLDSGADYCIFHSKWAVQIGLNLYAGQLDEPSGVHPGTTIKVYKHRIYLIVGTGNKMRCDVGFSEDIGDDINDQLIGRATVFNLMRFALRQKVLSLYTGTEPC